MTHEQIKNIPKDRTITYTCLVVDFRPQNEDPNSVRVSADSNLIKYLGKLNILTSEITITRIIWNTKVRVPNANYMSLDISIFYLKTPLD